MKHFLFPLTFLFAFFPLLNAKTVMTLTNGEEIDVIIEKMGTTEIDYKKASNPDGPSYSTLRSNVFFIVFDDGTKEIITPLNQSRTFNQKTGSTLTGNLQNMNRSLIVASDTIPERNYFPNISFFPRANIGWQGTPSSYSGITLDWGGLAWSVDLNVLFPISNTTAWSGGVGVSGLTGNMTAKSGKNKQTLNFMSATYFTIPLEYYIQCGEWFLFGIGDRIDILVSQRADGEKIEDTFNVFRDAVFMDGMLTLGHFNAGVRLLFNTTRAFKGDEIAWSPTFGIDFTIGYYF